MGFNPGGDALGTVKERKTGCCNDIATDGKGKEGGDGIRARWGCAGNGGDCGLGVAATRTSLKCTGRKVGGGGQDVAMILQQTGRGKEGGNGIRSQRRCAGNGGDGGGREI